jgi:hypothetical protein
LAPWSEGRLFLGRASLKQGRFKLLQ